MEISDINWLAVFVAAMAFFGLGMLWYGPLFGKPWQKAIADGSLTLKYSGTMGLFIAAFIMSIIVSVGMAFFLQGPQSHDEINAAYGALIGLMVGVLFILPTTVINYIFARRPLSLVLIDGFYHIIAITLVGAILGFWR